MWAVVLKPFGLIVLFGFVALLVYPLRKLPDSKIKRFLFIRWKV
jgi:hypothetical protein